eukprot:CAMPEP_0201523564 /NCGR_PEP_ID=MMETSP0161_2-20130828/20322_1 /ASSEMBLY_ACC=CAM_ASM_000251 /TAXON_ID=180227 /ORGANISM="Neoparamoeba aestuarina, Strain SoJaBio B1-5/56/2" /LENGTH=133 /DNA_ID=CAMNT_0047922725 /DNA_START=114 /DNA_END=515 /DNA_ORIENTATION=+
MAEARRNVLHLYKDVLRQVPILLDDYNIDVNLGFAKMILRHEFEKHGDLRNTVVIDQLVFKGRTELDEMQNKWMQRNHIMGYFQHSIEVQPDDEMMRFFTAYEVDVFDAEEGEDSERLLPPQIDPHTTGYKNL